MMLEIIICCTVTNDIFVYFKQNIHSLMLDKYNGIKFEHLETDISEVRSQFPIIFLCELALIRE